jgi:cell division septum initiation protein DivIVA
MKQIRCTLGTIRDAIAELEEYEKDLQKKVHTLMEKLAEVGIKEATVRFANVIYDGTNDVAVNQSPNWISDTKLVVSATGSSITFIEFGTGVFNTEVHPKAAELGAVRGAYGKGKGKNESWTYYGNEADTAAGGTVVRRGDKTVIRTHGNNPNRSMYDAAKEMREQITKLAEEVFGHD